MKSYRSAGDLPLVRDREPVPTSHARDTFPGLTSTDRAPHEEILHRAYAIWESEGHPDNRELANWLEAEAEVMAGG
jgi:hypothetical protein